MRTLFAFLLLISFAFTQTCFPVGKESFSYISWNWGGSRQNGYRCHAGIDIFTKNPGNVHAIADGTVLNIYNFYTCKDGWACKLSGANCPGQVLAVFIYHPSLNFTLNYGEIDAGHVKVSIGQTVKKGQLVGRAGYCGMLHLEKYSGKQTKNLQWYPPSGRTVPDPMNGCAKEFMHTKPAALQDPTPLIRELQGVWCSGETDNECTRVGGQCVTSCGTGKSRVYGVCPGTLHCCINGSDANCRNYASGAQCTTKARCTKKYVTGKCPGPTDVICCF